MSAEQLIEFHRGLNLAIWRWAWMIDALLATGDVVAYHAALALQDIQPGIVKIESEKASTAGAGR